MEKWVEIKECQILKEVPVREIITYHLKLQVQSGRCELVHMIQNLLVLLSTMCPQLFQLHQNMDK